MAGIGSPTQTAQTSIQSFNITQVGGASISLGQKVMASSLPVVLASDQTGFPVTQSGSWTVTANAGTGAFSIKTNDTVDANNSSTATLLANASFTGTGTDTLGYTSVAVYVYSDQSSAANGVKIEFSSDNTNWNDSTTDSFTAGNAAPNDGQTYLATLRARYFRVVYTNGAVNQTAFRLNSVLRVGTLSGDVIPVADVPNSIADHALLTKAAIVGKTTAGGGAWVDVKVNPSGALTVASTTQDSAGNSITSNSTTTTSTFGLDVNVRSILGTAPTTAGFLDIKGADGNVFVRQTTAANLNATVVGTGTFAVQATLAAETTKVIGTVNQGTSPWIVAGGGVAGTAATGVVTIQGISGMTKLLVTPDANSAVNVAQINGVTPLMGNGTTGTGSQRVTIASDNTVLPGVGAGATGSAVPANASYTGLDAATALPTAATAGNLTGAMSDKFGRQVVLQTTVRDLIGTQTTTISASTAETTIVTAIASTFNDLLLLVCSNTSATAARLDFRDTTGGSVLFSIYVPAGDVRGFSLGGVPIPQTSVNTNWTAQSSASVTDLRIYAVFAKNK